MAEKIHLQQNHTLIGPQGEECKVLMSPMSHESRVNESSLKKNKVRKVG